MNASAWKAIVSFFKIGLAVVSIVTPVLAVWDIRDPWPASDSVRIDFETDYVFVPIGGSWRGGNRLAQSALLVPRSASPPMAVSIRLSENGTEVQIDYLDFWFILLYVGIGWYLVFTYVRRWLVGHTET